MQILPCLQKRRKDLAIIVDFLERVIRSEDVVKRHSYAIFFFVLD